MSKIAIPYNEVLNNFEFLQTVPPGIDLIKARDVWETANQGEGKIIAILDTGVDPTHPDLNNCIIGGYNFTEIDNPYNFSDYHGHGTHISGIIAADNNKKGIVGVAPKSKLLILKVLNENGIGNYSNIINALEYASNWKGSNGESVDIINLSLNSKEHNEELYKTIKKVHSQGIVMVGAAGNSGDGKSDTYEKSFPGFYNEIITISSVNNKLIPSFFSDTNLNIDFVAPGENVLSTHLNGKYVELSGTSMAAAYVSGATALVLNMIENKDCTSLPYQVKEYYARTAKKLNFSISQVGNGFIQLI